VPAHGQTMRKRRRTLTPPHAFGSLTEEARPSVAANWSPPIVESATISSEEMVMCGATSRIALSPSTAGTPGPAATACQRRTR
jgi:hypothetical protein